MAVGRHRFIDETIKYSAYNYDENPGRADHVEGGPVRMCFCCVNNFQGLELIQCTERPLLPDAGIKGQYDYIVAQREGESR